MCRARASTSMPAPNSTRADSGWGFSAWQLRGPVIDFVVIDGLLVGCPRCLSRLLLRSRPEAAYGPHGDAAGPTAVALPPGLSWAVLAHARGIAAASRRPARVNTGEHNPQTSLPGARR